MSTSKPAHGAKKKLGKVLLFLLAGWIALTSLIGTLIIINIGRDYYSANITWVGVRPVLANIDIQLMDQGEKANGCRYALIDDMQGTPRADQWRMATNHGRIVRKIPRGYYNLFVSCPDSDREVALEVGWYGGATLWGLSGDSVDEDASAKGYQLDISPGWPSQNTSPTAPTPTPQFNDQPHQTT